MGRVLLRRAFPVSRAASLAGALALTSVLTTGVASAAAVRTSSTTRGEVRFVVTADPVARYSRQRCTVTVRRGSARRVVIVTVGYEGTRSGRARLRGLGRPRYTVRCRSEGRLTVLQEASRRGLPSPLAEACGSLEDPPRKPPVAVDGVSLYTQTFCEERTPVAGVFAFETVDAATAQQLASTPTTVLGPEVVLTSGPQAFGDVTCVIFALHGGQIPLCAAAIGPIVVAASGHAGGDRQLLVDQGIVTLLDWIAISAK